MFPIILVVVFLEKAYENAMMIEFKEDDIPAVSRYSIKVFYEGEIVENTLQTYLLMIR